MKRIPVSTVDELGGDELARELMREEIQAMSPEHYRECHRDSLEAVALARARLRRATTKLQSKRISLERYIAWSKIAQAESRLIASLATKLRKTPQHTSSKNVDPADPRRVPPPEQEASAKKGGKLGGNPLRDRTTSTGRRLH